MPHSPPPNLYKTIPTIRNIEWCKLNKMKLIVYRSFLKFSFFFVLNTLYAFFYSKTCSISTQASTCILIKIPTFTKKCTSLFRILLKFWRWQCVDYFVIGWNFSNKITESTNFTDLHGLTSEIHVVVVIMMVTFILKNWLHVPSV